LTKVLLITYYWPPAGGGGVHRWLKMSKYLVKMGIDLTVYTPSNPEYPVIDKSTVDDVHSDITVWKHPITEPYAWYKRFTGKQQDQKIYSGFINDKPSLTQRLSVWVRGNFFIPDARMMWIKPSVKYLAKRLQEEDFDCIISTGPPHSMHMIALGLKKRFPSLKWVADFRDPWTGIDFYDQLQLSASADHKHRKLEREVLTAADEVVTVSEQIAIDLSQLAGNRDVEVVTNGYDPADFSNEVKVSEKPEIVYLGSMNADRNPGVLWKAMREMLDRGIEPMLVRLIGQIDGKVLADIEALGLGDYVSIEDFVPHDEAVKIMQSAPALLLVVNNTPGAEGILTGKFFEYVGSRRPILCVGPQQGALRQVMSDQDSYHYVSYEDAAACVKVLQTLSQGYRNSTIGHDLGLHFSRKFLAERYLHIVNRKVA
jgi:glycosyltransferase involved in cell wall biosynthesis